MCYRQTQKRLYKAYIQYGTLYVLNLVAYVLETDNKSVKSIYTSQSEKLTQKEVSSAYTLICVRDRSDRDCREHIYIELGMRPN